MNRKWLETDDNYLLNNYARGKKEDILVKLNRTWCSINHRAKILKVKRELIENKGLVLELWSDEEIAFLIKNYCKTEKKVIIETLNRTWLSICQKAFGLKLRREILKPKNANAYKLINESNEAYYWLGFIMADGHFNNNDQIQINLAKKDLEHLKKFAKFVEYKKDLVKPSINIGFGDIREALNDKFKIHNDKTHYPCDLSKLFGDVFFSFIIGFIDGDGCINTKGYLIIKCHNSWLDNLNKMVSELSNNDFNHGRINSDGLAIIQLSKHKIMKEIKIKANELNLPILNRKWDRVNLKKEIKIDKENRMRHECNNLFKSGDTPIEIIKMNKFSRTFVYKMYQDYRISIKEKDIKRDLERNQ